MKNYFAVAVATAVLTGLALVGCYEPVQLTWYEAGVYKGADDPLLELAKQQDYEQTLSKRLRAVQTDR